MDRRFVAVIVSIVAVLASCSQAAGPQGAASPSATRKEGGTLRIVNGTEPGSLDPLVVTNDQTIMAGYNVVETLTTVYNEDGKVTPRLALSWVASPDAKTYTFTLRKDVMFQDGTAFDANAVKVNFDRIIGPNNKIASDYANLRNIKATTVLAPDKVQVDLTIANGFFPATLSTYESGILSPASLTKAPNTLQKVDQVVGSGPYKFVEYTPAVHVLLERNDGYWGPRPAYKNLEFKIAPDAAAREALLRSGGADVILQPVAADVASFRSDPAYNVLTAPSRRGIFIAINNLDRQQPLLQDKRVRLALNYAVDKQSIIKNVLFGLADESTSPIQPTVGECKTGQYAYDPQKAKDLLQQAGATGMKVKIQSPTGRYLQDFQAVTAIAGNLRDVGIQVDGPSTKDYPTYQAGLYQPPATATSDLGMFGNSPSYPDAGAQMINFNSALFPPVGGNISYYSNARVDDLIVRGNANPDRAAAFKDYCTAAQQIWDDAPWIFLWVQKAVHVSTAKVKGLILLPNEMLRYDSAYPAD